MLTKVLTIILVLFNPFNFYMVNTISLVEEPINVVGEKLEQWNESLISSILSTNPNFLPIRDWGIEEIETDSKSAIVYNSHLGKILYQKEPDQILPIASLTKIVTAIVVLENLDLKDEVVISEKAVAAYGDNGNLIIDEKISVKSLLYALLMESSNDAAIALAETVEQKTGQLFVHLMNQKVGDLDLNSTRFSDPSGYNSTNISTAREILKLIEYSFNQPIIWQIMKTTDINLSSVDEKIQHHWVNTDELLNRLPNIVGGKTGYTQEAQGCLVIVIEQPENGRLISVILGAQERFLETEKLINWVQEAYKW